MKNDEPVQGPPSSNGSFSPIKEHESEQSNEYSVEGREYFIRLPKDEDDEFADDPDFRAKVRQAWDPLNNYSPEARKKAQMRENVRYMLQEA